MEGTEVDEQRILEMFRTLDDRLARVEFALFGPSRVPTAMEAADSARPGVRELHINASEALRREDGFHGLEWAEDGTPYRWTMETVILTMHLDRSRPLVGTLTTVSPIPAGKFTTFVDGEGVDSVAIFGGRAIQCDLPATESAGMTRLVIRVAGTVNGGALDSDVRQLGVPFVSFDVGPTEAVGDKVGG
jgi:hypothetical protein